MLTLTCIICLVLLGKLIGSVFRVSWGITKVVLSLVFLPLILAVLVLGGLIYAALPLLLLVGVIALIVWAVRQGRRNGSDG